MKGHSILRSRTPSHPTYLAHAVAVVHMAVPGHRRAEPRVAAEHELVVLALGARVLRGILPRRAHARRDDDVVPLQVARAVVYLAVRRRGPESKQTSPLPRRALSSSVASTLGSSGGATARLGPESATTRTRR
jgi:hypothetical protein